MNIDNEEQRLQEELDEGTFDYKQDLEIDADALDLEWIHHPATFMRYAELLAKQERRVKHLEQKVKVLQSRLVLDVTKDPSILGSSIKATMQSIEAYYRTHPDYRQAKQDLHSAEYKRDLLGNAVNAFNQRKVALENLVKLLGQQYFAGPRTPRDLNTAEMQRKLNRVSATHKILEARKHVGSKAEKPGGEA